MRTRPARRPRGGPGSGSARGRSVMAENDPDELAGTENRISVERMRFNETVKNYNLRVRSFPSNLAAKFFGFEKKDIYFEASEGAKAVPKVQF